MTRERQDIQIRQTPNQQEQQPRFTHEQQTIIGEKALSYLRKNNIPYTRDTLTAALNVLGDDCVERGRAIQEKKGKDKTTSFRSLINLGLEQREHTAEKGLEILNQSASDMRNIPGEPAGTYAIPTVLYESAKSELEKHNKYLHPTLASTESLIRRVSDRVQVLPSLAELALSTLPEQKRPGLDRFPDADEQAKLAKNMLLSVAMRHNAVPLISLEELQDFLGNPQEMQQRLQPELYTSLYKQIAERLGGNPEETTRYLHDMLSQVSAACERYNKFSDLSSNSKRLQNETERMFFALQKHLLLLHPVLEEDIIQTNPQKHTPENVYSLWHESHSTVVDAYRIPTAEQLRRALRQQEVRKMPTERLEGGLRAWNAFESGEVAEQKLQEKKKKQLEELEHEHKQVKTQGLGHLTNAQLNHARIFLSAEYQDFSRHRQHLEKLHSGIASAIEKRNRFTNYMHEFKRLNDGVVPESAPLPNWLYEQRKTEVLGAKKRLATHANKNFSNGIMMLSNSFFATDQSTKEFTFEKLSNASEQTINAQIAKTRQTRKALEQVNTILPEGLITPPPFLLLERSEKKLRRINNEILSYTNGEQGRKKRVPSALYIKQTWLREMHHQLSRVLADPKNKAHSIPDNLLRDIYAFSLEEEITGWSLVKRAHDQIKNAAERYDPEKVSRFWSKEEIEQYEQEVSVSTIDVARIDPELIKSETPILQNWLAYTYNSGHQLPLPHIIPTRLQLGRMARNLKKEAEAKIIIESSKKQNAEIEGRIYRLERRIKHYEAFLAALGSPLFPLPEGRGMGRHSFMLNFGRRVKLLKELNNVDTAEVVAHQKYAQLHSRYERSLDNRIKRLRIEIERVETVSPVKQRFLETMKELDFLIPQVTTVFEETTNKKSKLLSS
jgi:hypothetical protein